MKRIALSIVTVAALGLVAFTPIADKLVSSKTHIKFFSHTSAEDIEANNYKMVSTIDPNSGAVVFSVPMQSFEFEKALMQKHFNSPKFLDTKVNPKAKLKGNITNLSEIHFDKDGTYPANVKGEMTINGITNPIEEKAIITIKSGKVSLESKFNLTLAEYEVAFEKGKPSTNIAEVVEVTVHAEY